ncbi:MAG: glycosyltransferase [Verrucomicrobia bacterium]|nr:MAG: glycosyltransferase [Verrucomicrobiota bacterium]
MRLSVVIPAFNEEKLLPATLRAVRAALPEFERRGWQAEIVVCDNHSTDGTARVAAEGGARVVFESVNMISRARNAGAAAANGDWLLFLDADSTPSPALFAATAEAMASGGVLAGGTTLRMDGGGWSVHALAAVWNLVSRLARRFAGSFIFVRADAFREVGGFSERHFAGEELDLAKRLHRIARRDGLAIRILSATPLLTSARKARLYTPRELGRFLLRAALRPEATMTDREACAPWYDGRR